MNNVYILTLDYGTQSARAAIFDDQGNTLALEKEPYETPYFSPEKEYFEQNVEYYWEKMCKATNKLKKNNSDLLSNLKGIVATHFRDSAVLLDKDLNPIRPSILWLDQRVARPKTKQALWRRMIFALVGMSETIKVQRSKTMANWYQIHEIDNWKKTHKYVNISTYLNYRLTGQLKDSASNQTGHYPIDFKKGKWLSPHSLKFETFGIPSRMLCELVEPYDVIGTVTEKASLESGIPQGLPLFASGTDKSSESVGTGCVDPSYASISYGTASTIEVTNPKYHEPETFLPAYPSSMKNYYNMEVQIYRGYWMLNWFKDEFAKEETIESSIQQLAVLDILNKKMLEIPPGSDGLLLQPYWGPSLKKPNAKGSVIGFSDHHTRIHLYRAIIEGIAYSLKDGLEGIERKQHKKVSKITVSGGGSSSNAICQITADIFGLPVYRVQTFETASLGSAIIGFVALKHYSSENEAIKKMVHYQKPFEPNLENTKRYNFLYYHVYKKLYPRLKSLYKTIRVFSNSEF